MKSWDKLSHEEKREEVEKAIESLAYENGDTDVGIVL